MKSFDWNSEQNQHLIEERGFSFEDASYYLLKGGLIDDVSHPSSEKYPNQRIFVIDVEGYVYFIPYVESKEYIFLKTIIPAAKRPGTISEDLMNKPKWSREEKEILKAFEADDLKSNPTKKRKREVEAAAGATFKKDKRINIRISRRDLSAIQRRALEEGIPYQTLVSSVLHKYVSGGLRDISADKASKKPDDEATA